MVPQRLPRRRVLASGGAVTAAMIAGCLGEDGGDGDDADGGGEGDGDGDGGDGDGGDGDGDDGGDGEQNTDGVLLFTQVKGPLEFDPITLNDVPSAQITGKIFEGLYEYNEDATEMVPQLATGEPEVEEDGTRWIAEIEEDATFQNGDPVTAEDVAYSLTAPVEEETDNAAELDMIESAETIDEKTVQFDLEFPYAAFDITIGYPVVPMDVREEDREAFKTDPVGSGPFQFVEWQEGDYTLIERWDDYWGEETPNLAEVEFDAVEEQTTRVTGLETEESDIIETVPPQLWEEVEDMSGAEIVSELGIGYFYLAFNCAEGPTADPQVREAVDYVFSMDEAVASFVEPAGVRQYSPFPQSIVEGWDFPADEWAEIPHDRDLDQAEQLFDEAGVDSDYEWNIIVPPDDMREQIGVSVSNGLQEIGFDDVSMERLDWGPFLDRYNTGDENEYNMYTLGWSGSPDPEAFTYYLFAQEVEGVTNGTFYDNDEVDDLIVEARETPDREERREMYIDAVDTLLEDRVHLPAYNLYNSYGVRDYVQDFQAHPSSSVIPLSTQYNNVSVE